MKQMAKELTSIPIVPMSQADVNAVREIFCGVNHKSDRDAVNAVMDYLESANPNLRICTAIGIHPGGFHIDFKYAAKEYEQTTSQNQT